MNPLAVKCPRCGAAPGEKCRDMRMPYPERLSIRTVHKQRREQRDGEDA